jgi:hypothetical protein
MVPPHHPLKRTVMTTNLLLHTVANHEIRRRLHEADEARLGRLARGPRRWPTHPRERR